jgi:hypothetical protein
MIRANRIGAFVSRLNKGTSSPAPTHEKKGSTIRDDLKSSLYLYTSLKGVRYLSPKQVEDNIVEFNI